MFISFFLFFRCRLDDRDSIGIELDRVGLSSGAIAGITFGAVLLVLVVVGLT